MSLKKSLNKILRPFNMQVHGLGYLQSLAKGDFKKNEFDYFLEKFAKKPITIFDVGANRGLMLGTFLEQFPSATIIAFEPIASLCEEMRHLYGSRKNVKIKNVGISDRIDELPFYINKSVDTSSFLPSQTTGLNSDPQVKTIEKITVPVTTIEQSFLENGIEQINILKLDIQGSELKALKGAANLLRDKKIDIIYSETYFIKQYVDQPLFPEIAQYLLDYGYVLQDIYHPVYGKGRLAWCDVIFVRNDL